MMTAPRYTPSVPLQRLFLRNVDFSGDNIFYQLKRDGNVAIYRRNRADDNRLNGYEVIVIKTVKAGSALPNGAVVAEDYEVYPGAKAFGKMGWYYTREDQAENKFEDVVKSKEVVVDKESSEEVSETSDVVEVKPREFTKEYNLPDGEFTKANFAELNGIDTLTASVILTSYSESGKVRKAGQVKTGGRGRPAFLYVKN